MELLHFALVVAVAACTVKESHQGPNQRRLLKELFTSYNRLERPVLNDSQPLTVSIGLNLMQILDVDEKNQVLTTNIWLQLGWNDNFLQWNPEEYPGVANIRFPENLIWKPDILLYNSADERFDTTFHTNILVNSSGNCDYIPPGIFKSTCSIDVRWFPFDVQRCDLKFGSWTHGGWLLDLKMIEPDITHYTPNGEWDLIEVTGKRNDIVYECCAEPYPDITFTLVLQRRTLYYGLNLLIPCVLISTMALLVFLLPADSGEKITLGITVLLSLTVLMLLVAEIMPPTSISVPLIAQYFATTLVIVGVSVIATVLVLQFHHHDPNGSKMPKWTRVFLLNWCAWFLRMKRPGEDKDHSACHNKGERSSLSSMELIASSPASQSTNGKALYGRLPGHAGEEVKLLPKAQDPSVGGVEPALAKILEEVHHIAKRFHDQDENESVCNEWKFAAAVIDRLCLIAFSIVTILCTIGILMSSPKYVKALSKDISN
ncbi:neuronal acetylcholine receptor subunit alpha-7a [Platichthys flesus]|uniref:neuronal acetylcholine receptor subunit alpha-7a n=1 Tax=Platichthys flesus TaxID=8260 RepID=UPI002DB9558D|nr:neuronal acetylcholine receptor subunit alpha-7a [Platichthys flesus]